MRKRYYIYIKKGTMRENREREKKIKREREKKIKREREKREEREIKR